MGFAPSDMQLTSTAFENGAAIPSQYTGEGADISPELSWSPAPEGARSFAVICHDPDAPLVTPNGNYGFVHWVLYNIPGSAAGLSEGSGEYTLGNNNFGNAGYGGPMPPPGHGKHHYFFWVLALNEELNLEPGLSLTDLLAAVEPNLIGMNRLVGTYQRD